LKEKIAEWSEADKINALGYPVDGLVVAYDDTNKVKGLEGTEHHPSLTKSMAFKWQDEKVQTKLTAIEWSPSRTGLLNPVAVFDTVDLCGTKVSRASLHNVSYIQNLNLKVGDNITVYKANMIIPQMAENLDRDKGITDVMHGVECPCCKNRVDLTKIR
jgi:DNA ligase (NAD+)